LGLLISAGYLIIFNPFTSTHNIIQLRVWISGISFPVIALIAVFCYQSRNNAKEIVNDTNNKFYELLLENGLLDEIIFLYKWNVNIGVYTILVIIAYNIMIYSRQVNNVTLGFFATIPIFLVVWTTSEFRYSNQMANKLNENGLEYRKIISLRK
jgi:hypothetical protein